MWRLAAVLLLWSCAYCSAAVFPTLTPGSAYTDGKIRLRLMERHFFVLDAADGPSTPNVTGMWRQTGDGALLQLTNRNGFSRILNVGGGGDLYGDFPDSGILPRATTLHPVPGGDGQNIPFLLEGTLAGTEEGLTLTDWASGLTFMVREVPEKGEAWPDQKPAAPLFVTVRAHAEGNELFLVQVLAQSSHLPPASPPESLARSVGRMGWLLRLPNLPPLSCFFTPAVQDKSPSPGREKGLLEVTGQGLHFQTVYAAEGARLRVRVEQKDAARLAAVGADALAAFFRNVCGWAREGEVLILTGKNDRQQVLEMVGQKR